MSEEKLLKNLVNHAKDIPSNHIDLTAGVMESIHSEIGTNFIDLDNALIEQKSMNILYWASGISIAVSIIALIGLNFFINDVQYYANYSLLNILVPI